MEIEVDVNGGGWMHTDVLVQIFEISHGMKLGLDKAGSGLGCEHSREYVS